MSQTHLELARFTASLDYSERPDLAELALEVIGRCRAILEDPRYHVILLDGHADCAEDLAYWASKKNHGNENDLP